MCGIPPSGHLLAWVYAHRLGVVLAAISGLRQPGQRSFLLRRLGPHRSRQQLARTRMGPAWRHVRSATCWREPLALRSRSRWSATTSRTPAQPPTRRFTARACAPSRAVAAGSRALRSPLRNSSIGRSGPAPRGQPTSCRSATPGSSRLSVARMSSRSWRRSSIVSARRLGCALDSRGRCHLEPFRCRRHERVRTFTGAGVGLRTRALGSDVAACLPRGCGWWHIGAAP